MDYLKRSCPIKAKTLRVSWWLTSVHWWECRRYRPAHTIHRLMANVRGSTPLWLVCWECYPNYTWNMYSGMKLPSLPVSIVFGISNAVSPTCISKSAIISDHFLFKYNELILIVSMSSPWDSGPISISTSCTMQFLLLMHAFLKCPVLLHAVHVFPYAGHCLGVWPPPQYLHGCLWCVALFASLPSVFFGTGSLFTLSNVLVSVMSFNMDACAPLHFNSWPH